MENLLKTLKIMLSYIFCSALVMATYGQNWILISNDAQGDVTTGIDATKLEMNYDTLNDRLQYRITCANLANYTSSPAADFSFYFPKGVDGNEPAGTHWSAPGQPVHKSIYSYTDAGGTPPSNYTYHNSHQIIELAGGSGKTLCSDCVSIHVDPSANQLTYSLNRKDLITDTEWGTEKKVELTLVANVGFNSSWNDNITKTAKVVIQKIESTGPSSVNMAVKRSLGISLYPNPAWDVVSLHNASFSAIGEINLLDIQGKVVVQNKKPLEENATLTISIADLKPGLYFIVAQSSEGAIRKKLIVE